MNLMVARTRIRGLGQPPGFSHIHVRVIDRRGVPLSGVRFSAHGVVGETNGEGFGLIEVPAPVGSEAALSVDLPEGTAWRQVVTIPHISGKVEVFQSVTSKSEPAITVAEGLSFGVGLILTAYGLSLKRSKAEEVLIGLGTGFAAISGFSLVFRHLR